MSFKQRNESRGAIPFVSYSSARDAAAALERHLQGIGRRDVRIRPWHDERQDTTEWWLVPSKEWPGYRYGKILVSPYRASEGHLFLGLHVEKGLDPSVARTLGSRRAPRWILQPGWKWHDFLRDLGSGKVAGAIRRFHDAMELPAALRIEAGVVRKAREFDPFEARAHWDTIVFRSTGSLLQTERNVLPSGLLAQAAAARRVEDLPPALAAMRDSEWVWVDVFLGTEVARDPAASAAAAWAAGRLWKQALAMWDPWFA